MAENKIYVAIGEEATRGTKEATTVGFIPLLNNGIPEYEPDDKKRSEFRGEDTVKGDTTIIRMSQKLSGSLETNVFTEAGTTKGMFGTLLKHFFGKATTVQNGTTGQYAHMLYGVPDPFASANLGTKALTINLNINEGATMKNYPYLGARIKSLSFEQEAGEHLKCIMEYFGQKRDTVTTEVGSSVFPAENLRCDFNNLKVYTGTITRVGTAPDYTDITFGSATQLIPDKVSIKIENGMEDTIRISGLDYPDKTRMGKFKVTLEMTFDWEAPGSGFNSIDEYNNWVAGASSTNFCFYWDTGTPAGTGGNHGLYIDIPIAQRMGGKPEYSLDKDPMIPLKYEGLYDPTTTKYLLGILLKNTATAV